MNAKQLRAEAMRLPSEERMMLARELLESAFGGEELDTLDWNAAWAPEILQRLNDIECGAVKTIAGDAAFAEIRGAIETARS